MDIFADLGESCGVSAARKEEKSRWKRKRDTD
jgi:hypothetical protein